MGFVIGVYFLYAAHKRYQISWESIVKCFFIVLVFIVLRLVIEVDILENNVLFRLHLHRQFAQQIGLHRAIFDFL